ncbi:hypothetical protein [Paraburkholderia caribensis]|uniref:hypothetical protein n=1 Tax=Paraburkholderia caribensis TaxID=75105 RepID=UPI0034D1D6D9
MAKSDKARTSAQRQARLDAGWKEVRVWAASPDDVPAIRKFAEELRMKSINNTVRQIARERSMPPAVMQRAVDALAQQDSCEFNTPSGASLTLMTDLARAQQLDDLNTFVKMFAAAYPGNAQFVAASVPAKLLSNALAYRLDFRSTERILKFQAAHPDLASEIQAAIGGYTLDAWAQAAVQEMMAYDLN